MIRALRTICGLWGVCFVTLGFLINATDQTRIPQENGVVAFIIGFILITISGLLDNYKEW
jgi:hypothetical protein